MENTSLHFFLQQQEIAASSMGEILSQTLNENDDRHDALEFEAEVLDSHVEEILDQNVADEEGTIGLEINGEGNILENITEESLSQTMPKQNFADHLFWASPIEHNKSKKRTTERLPSAISSAAYRTYLKEKENKIKQRVKNAGKRQTERQKRALEKRNTSKNP